MRIDTHRLLHIDRLICIESISNVAAQKSERTSRASGSRRSSRHWRSWRRRLGRWCSRRVYLTLHLQQLHLSFQI